MDVTFPAEVLSLSLFRWMLKHSVWASADMSFVPKHGKSLIGFGTP